MSDKKKNMAICLLEKLLAIKEIDFRTKWHNWIFLKKKKHIFPALTLRPMVSRTGQSLVSDLVHWAIGAQWSVNYPCVDYLCRWLTVVVCRVSLKCQKYKHYVLHIQASRNATSLLCVWQLWYIRSQDICFSGMSARNGLHAAQYDKCWWTTKSQEHWHGRCSVCEVMTPPSTSIRLLAPFGSE
jgi:hypothetical protein